MSSTKEIPFALNISSQMPIEKSNRKTRRSNSRWILEKIFLLLRQHGNTLVWAVVVVYAIHQGASVLLAYAGRTSAASLFLSIVAKGSLTVKISLVFGGLSTILFFLEHRRHIQTRERLTERIGKLERQIDARRTSSGLTTTGKTRAGDR